MEKEIPALREEEIAVSCKGLASHYIGNSDKLAKQLKNVIDKDLQDDGQNQVWVTIGEERFFLDRRQFGNHVIWALPLSDKARLAGAMGWRPKVELDQLQDSEIALSAQGLSPHFTGNGGNLRDQLRGMFTVDPEMTILSQLTCTIGEEAFTFGRRQNGGRTVWALPLTDKARFARAMGWIERVELFQIQENEIALSGSALSPYFIGAGSSLRNQLRKVLSVEAKKTTLPQLTCTIGEETFILRRRQTGVRTVWALSLSDKGRFARAMGWREKVELEPLQDNEIAMSAGGLSPHFIGNEDNLKNQLRKVLSVDSEKTTLSQLKCTIGEETFTFQRRQTGVRTVWALPLSEKARFALAMGLREKVELAQLQDKEIAVSAGGLSPHFIGERGKLRNQLREVLASDPEKTTCPQLECIIGEEVFTFSRRLAGTRVIWALPLSDKARLARAMGWRESDNAVEKIKSEQLQENEIAISVSGLSPHFTGHAASLKKQVQALLAVNPERTPLSQLTCTINEETFSLSRRQQGTHSLWALPLSDKKRFARAMGWMEKAELSQPQSNEIVVSKNGLSPHFTGDSGDLRRQLLEILKADPRKTSSPQMTCAFGKETLVVHRRQLGGRIVWALPLADRARLAKAMNWEIRKEKEPSAGVADLATFFSALRNQEETNSHQNEERTT